jgi:hypothetical protein
MSLTSGVLPVKSLAVRLLALACAGGLAAGLFAMQKQPEEPLVAPPALPAKLLAPDPKAPAVAKELAGVWRWSVTAPDGDTIRTETLRFVDGKYLVWQVHLRSPGVDTSVTLRGRYARKVGELVFDVTEKWAGEEQVKVRPDEVNRKYKFVWSANQASFTLTSTVAATNNPMAGREFRQVNDEATETAVPAALAMIDRAIKKEPKYTAEPRYLLLAFGPEAKFRAWVVLDGTTLYVDHNGNGDLTDDGERFEDGELRMDARGEVKSMAYMGIDLAEPGGSKHTNLMFSALNLETNSTFATIIVTVNDKTEQMAGLTNLRLAESAKEAQVVHFGAKDVTVRPSVSMPGHPNAKAPANFRVQVGTPGIGSGSFASFLNERTAEGVGPVAEFEFTPLQAGEAARKVTLHLKERCCGDQFFAKLTVPEGVKTGLDAAKVTLSYPNCPWGKVEPVTYLVDVIPKK